MKLSDLKRSLSEKSIPELQLELTAIRNNRYSNANRAPREAKTTTKRDLTSFISGLSQQDAAALLESLQ